MTARMTDEDFDVLVAEPVDMRHRTVFDEARRARESERRLAGVLEDLDRLPCANGNCLSASAGGGHEPCGFHEAIGMALMHVRRAAAET